MKWPTQQPVRKRYGLEKMFSKEDKDLYQTLKEIRQAELKKLNAPPSEYFERGEPLDTRRPFTFFHLVGVLSTLLVLIPVVVGIAYGLYQIGLFWCCAFMVFLGAMSRK